jgi:hypothetical protein
MDGRVMPLACDGQPRPCFGGFAAAIITAAAVLHAVLILHAEPLQSANDRSRWCTIRSLLEDGSYQIDRVRQIPSWDTIDLIRVDGHFYSTKPPLMATWVAGVVKGIQSVTGWTFERDIKAINQATLLVINGLPLVIGLIALAIRLPSLTSNSTTAGFVMLTAAFATLLSPFAASLNNHSAAAFGVAVAIFCWLRPELPATIPGRWLWFAIWGFACGWAVCHDLPAGLFGAAMCLEAARQSKSATVLGFLPGAAVPVIAFLACNIAATGTLIPAYAGYGGESYRFIHEGVPSYWLDPQGVDRNLDTLPAYLFHCLLGHHGWFSLTPLWLILLAAVPFTRPQESPRLQRLLWGTLLVTAGIVAFYLTRTKNYNYGGVSCGLRWAVFLTPLWVASLAVALDRLACFPRAIGGLSLIALTVSTYSAWEPLGRPWQQPWLFRVGEQRGWFNYQSPLQNLPRPLYGWITELPGTDAAAWQEFRRTDAIGGPETLRLEQQPDESVGGRTLAVIAVERRHRDSIVDRHLLRIDRQRFAAGRPPAECLVWPDVDVTSAAQQADLATYRGLPLMRPYHPGVVRYLKTPLRTDALVCQRTAAQVDHGLKDAPPLRYRCDVWRTSELPFGIARVEWTVTDPATGNVLQREAWEATAVHPPVAPTSPLRIEDFPLP